VKQRVWAMTAVAVLALSAALAGGEQTLKIYFIDVEGGQSTLVVTAAGESLLIDTGFPSDDAVIPPAFGAKPGASAEGRDPRRILAAARDAGVRRIDYLLLTHFHADHDGGVVELSKLLPIRAFIDHGAPGPGADAAVPGTEELYHAYLKVRGKGRHIEPKAGDRLPLEGVEAVIVAAAGAGLARPLPGAGGANPACSGEGLPAQEKTENPRSTAVRLQYGNFRFLDVGDLSGPPLFALTCPDNLIGESDVYLIAHHAGADAADPSLFMAVKPLVAVVNNGPRKGAQVETLATLGEIPSIDGWQLHRTLNAGAENVPEDRIANLDETTNAWIKVSASRDGSFTVTNGRTGVSRSYRR
jgi:competence protein ComEC